jgi:hypothetical protein
MLPKSGALAKWRRNSAGSEPGPNLWQKEEEEVVYDGDRSVGSEETCLGRLLDFLKPYSIREWG